MLLPPGAFIISSVFKKDQAGYTFSTHKNTEIKFAIITLWEIFTINTKCTMDTWYYAAGVILKRILEMELHPKHQ